MVTLGVEPVRIELTLSRGGDFGCTLHSNEGDWSVTSAVTLEVGSQTWTAVADGPDAAFVVDLAEVDTAIAEAPRAARLWYEDGELRMLWGYGPVIVRG